MTANRAANSISAPRIIWYTLAVTDSSPMFMRMVATRSKKEGMASSSVSLREPFWMPDCLIGGCLGGKGVFEGGRGEWRAGKGRVRTRREGAWYANKVSKKGAGLRRLQLLGGI